MEPFSINNTSGDVFHHSLVISFSLQLKTKQKHILGCTSTYNNTNIYIRHERHDLLVGLMLSNNSVLVSLGIISLYSWRFPDVHSMSRCKIRLVFEALNSALLCSCLREREREPVPDKQIRMSKEVGVHLQQRPPLQDERGQHHLSRRRRRRRQ